MQTQELIDMHTEIVRLRATIKQLEKNSYNKDQNRDQSHNYSNNSSNRKVDGRRTPTSKSKIDNDSNQANNTGKQIVNTSTGKIVKEAPV